MCTISATSKACPIDSNHDDDQLCLTPGSKSESPEVEPPTSKATFPKPPAKVETPPPESENAQKKRRASHILPTSKAMFCKRRKNPDVNAEHKVKCEVKQELEQNASPPVTSNARVPPPVETKREVKHEEPPFESNRDVKHEVEYVHDSPTAPNSIGRYPPSANTENARTERIHTYNRFNPDTFRREREAKWVNQPQNRADESPQYRQAPIVKVGRITPSHGAQSVRHPPKATPKVKSEGKNFVSRAQRGRSSPNRPTRPARIRLTRVISNEIVSTAVDSAKAAHAVTRPLKRTTKLPKDKNKLVFTTPLCHYPYLLRYTVSILVYRANNA